MKSSVEAVAGSVWTSEKLCAAKRGWRSFSSDIMFSKSGQPLQEDPPEARCGVTQKACEDLRLNNTAFKGLCDSGWRQRDIRSRAIHVLVPVGGSTEVVLFNPVRCVKTAIMNNDGLSSEEWRVGRGK